MSSDKDSTRKVRTSDLNKKPRKKKSKTKKVKFKDKHPKASKAIKIGILVFILLIIIAAGILVGAFVGIFGDELKIDEESLVVGYENSTVYDADGNLIATLSGGTKRKSISLSDMSEYLPKAYVAIEDERFYKHSGIDIGRTIYATITYVLHGGSSSFGGSTITQQVIKNITQDKEKTAFAGVMRKIKEISKAIQVEHYLSKDQILELYLNLIFVGGDDINGVELGSIYYFNKSAKDLSIAECAFMAGINHSPNAYKPFADYSDSENPEEKKQEMTDKINKRTKTVLSKMEELGYITKDQYDEAVQEVDNGLNFQKGDSASVTTDVSYLTEAAIDQILDQILEENEDMNRDAAEMLLYSSGYKIYTTQKTEIQNILEEEISKDIYITSYTEKNSETGETETYYSIPTMTIMDHTTGQVVAAATATGSSDERTATTKLGYFNYPTKNKKQTGSCMKPISVIAPGLESGKITGATVFYDAQTTWGTGSNAYTPKNYNGYSNTLMNMRNAIRASVNVPHVKALSVIGTEAAVEFCESVGLPNFEAEGLSLSLGGLNDGVSTLQMAGAYSAIANDGVYITPTFYTKVTKADGTVVYEPNQEETRVMTEQNAYIEKSILTEPVVGASGAGGNSTATYCAINGMDVAAKTGTTNSDYDRWLCGFTPYYTATCWYGYKDSHAVVYNKGLGGNPAGRIWDAVMTKIHEDLPSARFEEPDGIIRATVCKASGLLATETCGDNIYQEVFSETNVPTSYCEGHSTISICQDSGLLSAGACPNVTTTYQYLPEYEKNAVWHTVGLEGATGTVPTEYCTLHPVGGGTSYVTEEDQVKFQAATDGAALGLFGTDLDNYINQKVEEWRNGKSSSSSSSTASQQTQQSTNTTNNTNNSNNTNTAGSSGTGETSSGGDSSTGTTDSSQTPSGGDTSGSDTTAGSGSTDSSGTGDPDTGGTEGATTGL